MKRIRRRRRTGKKLLRESMTGRKLEDEEGCWVERTMIWSAEAAMTGYGRWTRQRTVALAQPPV